MNEEFKELDPTLIKVIKCNNIYTDSSAAPISGLLIFSSKFEKIIDFSCCSEMEKNDFSKNHQIIDFSDSYIFPGIIDMNVHLNCNYEESEWVNIEEITKLAIQGGITTLIDNPIMNNYDEQFDELVCLKSRISALRENIYSDCGLFSYIGKHNVMKIEEIHDSKLALGYKIHLNRTWMPELPYMNKKAFGQLIKLIKEKNSLRNILLAFHSVSASDKEFFICSPLRTERKEVRYQAEIISKASDFRGGLAEDFDPNSNEDDPKRQYLLDEEIDEWMESTDKSRSKLSQNGIGKFQKLETQAKIVAKFQEENSIVRMELSQYNPKDSPLIEALEQSSSSSFIESDISAKNEISEINSSSNEKLNSVPLNPPKQCQTSPIIKSSLQAFQSKKVPPLIVFNKLTTSADDKEQGIYDREEIKTADAIIKKESLKLVSEPSKLLSRRMVSLVNVTSEKSMEQLNSLNSFSSFEAIKKQDLKTDNKPNKERENVLNHNYDIFLSNHILLWEVKGIRMILKKTEKVFRNSEQKDTVKLLFMNISSNALLFQVNKFKEINEISQKINVLTEVCAPYFFFYNTKIRQSQTKFKVSPPIRIKKERDLFLQTVKQDGLVDVVSSFHFTVPWKYKYIDKGNFRRSFEGLSCLGFNLQLLWTKLFQNTQKASSKDQAIRMILENENMQSKAIKIEIETFQKIFKLLINKLCENPSKILNLKKKGRISVGLDADFLIWNPFKSYRIKAKDLPLKETKGFIPLNNEVYGEIKETYLRGELVFQRNEKGPHLYRKKGDILERE